MQPDGEINYYYSKVTWVQLATQYNIDNESKERQKQVPFHLTV